MPTRVGRVKIVERPDALIVTSPFFARTRAIVLGIAIVLVFAGLRAVSAAKSDVAYFVVLVICGYVAAIFVFNRTVATIHRDRIVVRRGPIPMWPASTIDVSAIEDVRGVVARGITARGGRTEFHTVAAVLANGGTATVIDDAGNPADAAHVAAEIAAWLRRHRPTR
jgi:hypothetical protein